jgi:hypothetical protein
VAKPANVRADNPMNCSGYSRTEPKPTDINVARSERDFLEATFRRIGNNLADPEWVAHVVADHARNAAELASVEIGEESVFVLMSFREHRTWVIGNTSYKETGRHSTHAMHEWHTARELHVMRSGGAGAVAAKPSIFEVRPLHLNGAVILRVDPHGVRELLLSRYPSIAQRADLDDLDPIAMLRIYIRLANTNALDSDELAQQRAVRHALSMRDLVRQCFSKHPDLWKGAPLVDEV